MGNKGNKMDECSLSVCPLPDNNKIFWYQFVYLTICWFMLLADANRIDAFNLAMFIAPLFLDLFKLTSSKRYIRVLTNIYCVLNSLVVIVIFMNMGGALTEEGTLFVLSDSAIALAGVKISKKVILFALLPDILIPVIVGIGTPTKGTIRALNHYNNQTLQKVVQNQ